MKKLAQFIDHTLLKPYCTKKEVEKLCMEALTYRFASVCVLPCFVLRAKKKLQQSSVHVSTVIGFPLGAHLTEVKILEAQKAIEQGCDELDIVINLTAVKALDFTFILSELKALRELSSSVILKAIIETCYLDEQEITKLCQIIMEANFDFVKTSTGFGISGAKISDVQLMKKIVGDNIQIKASGGIKDFKTALEFVDAGATRLGTSQALAIIGS